MNALQPTETPAVLTLSETGEILAAREACPAVFGRDVGALIGVNIRVLLKGGLDNEIGRLLHSHRTGKNPGESVPLRVIALRKDSTEFLACATTLKWNSDTPVTGKSDAARLTWTIEFRELAISGEKTEQTPSERPPADEVSETGKTSESIREVVVASPLSEGSSSLRGKEESFSGESTVTLEQKPDTESQQRGQDFETQLRKTAEELAAFKAEASRRAEAQQKVESELRAHCLLYTSPSPRDS